MKNKAFTLIELLVVVLIIGILAAIALPKYEKAVEKSRAAEAVQILKYMHNQAVLCELARPGDCGALSNDDLGIELGGNFICDYDGYTERCCNDHWCYDNNGVKSGDVCVGDESKAPLAFRITGGKPNDVEEAISVEMYMLQFDDCENAQHPNQIVCYDSDKWCKMWQGRGNPIN